MSQHTASARTLSFRSMLLLLVLSLSTAFAIAQNLTFTPGVASAYVGEPAATSSTPPTGPYTGSPSGVVLDMPSNIVFDKSGNLYSIEENGNIVRVVAGSNNPIPVLPGVTVQAGQIYTVAGGINTGTGGTPCTGGADAEGNGCPATQAAILYNNLLGIDGNGNLYVGDYSYNQVRVIYSGTGTIAGVTNPKAGYIYALTNVANSSKNTLPSMNSPIPAASAVFTGILSIAVDSYGNVYLSGGGGTSLYLIYQGGNLPSGFFNGATPVAGDMYLLSPLNNCSDADLICDGYPIANAAFLNLIDAMTVDASGNLYLSDDASGEIRAVYVAGTLPGVSNPQPGYIYDVAGNVSFALAGISGPPVNGPATASSLILNPTAMGMSSDSMGNIYFTANTSAGGPSYVGKIDSLDNLTVVLGGATAPCVSPTDAYNDGCPATSISVTDASPDYGFGGVAVDSASNIYVANSSSTPQGSLIFKSDVTRGVLDYSIAAGSTASNQINITNMGSQPLQLSGLVFSGPYVQISSGSTDCSSSTSLAENASCTVAVSFAPTVPGAFPGSLAISSNSLNASSQVNTVTLNGTATKGASAISEIASPGFPARANPGQSVTFTATAAAALTTNALVPSGTIAFMNGSTTLNTATLSNGVATFSIATLPAGTYSVTAVYSGDTNFNGSTSAPVTVVVSSTPVPIVTLTTSSAAANSGQSITLTANVAAFSGSGIPTGAITFQVGNNPLPNGMVTLAGGTATYTTSTLPVGTNQLVAFYGGDSQFGPNASSEVTVAVASAGQLQLTPGTISALAGTYFTSGSGGNGVPATSVGIVTPGVAVDSFGNTYIAGGQGAGGVFVIASGNGSIPGITNPVKGDIYPLGTGKPCSASAACGDGGAVSQASFDSPQSIFVDGLNNIYISDYVKEGTGGGNSVIRKVSATTGMINTVAGTWGAIGYSGDGGPATSALVGVWNFFVDQNGNIYIADNTGFLVRRVDAQTGIITTIAGNTVGAWTEIGEGFNPNACKTMPCGDGGPATSAALLGPTSVFVDAANNIYISDNGAFTGNPSPSGVLRKIDGKTGVISLVSGQYGQYCTVAPCGDGGPASSALFGTISDITGDSAGNLYLADNTLAVVREISAQTGVINTVIGNHTGEGFLSTNQENLCTAAAAPCGDGGPATSALLKNPGGIALDSQGNMYVSDTGTDVVREVSVTSLALNYGSQDLGTTESKTVTISNTGLQPLMLSGLSIPAPNYVQQPSGGADCDASTTLTTGTSCQLAIAFFPTVSGPLSGTASIASNSSNATNGQNTIALSGTGTGLGGTTAQTITFPAVTAGLVYGSSPILLNASSDSGQPITYEAIGPATISGSTLTITGAGTVKVTAYQFGNSQYAAAAPVSQSISVAQATLTVAATNLSLAVGAVLPAPSFTITGFVGNDTQQSSTTGAPSLTVVDASGTTYPVGSTPLSGTYTITVQQGTLALTGQAATNYKLVFANGTLNVTGSTPQTISFPMLSNVSYGASAVSLTASATSGLPIAYTVVGPASVFGNLLTITGAGPVAVTANQSGNAQYAAAIPITMSFIVNKAALNVTANSISVAQGSPIPALTYTVTGFVNNDTQAVVTGSPILTTTATNKSPIGQYPITVAVGTLAAANYSFNLGQGSNVSIVTPTAQTISFSAIAGVTYGASPIVLNATSSSGLGVSYTITGPASLSGNVLTINGVGTVTVTANQAGNNTYGPASPVAQSFTVTPAVLTVTANNTTRLNDTQNPTFTSTTTGFVNGDTPNIVVSGTPAFTTTATASSAVGTYPISVSVGTLKAANYTFNFVAGTLTITTGGPSPNFSLTATPQSIMVEQGQIAQATITLSPVNYYQGLVKLSCGSLPANVSCTFSPATLTADGSNTPVSGTLTINTNSATPVVGQIQPMKRTQVTSAAFFYLPAGLAGLLIAVCRKRILKNGRMQQWLLFLLLFAGVAGLSGCGSSPSSPQNSTVAAPGSSVITLTAADSNGGASQTINISIKVQ